MNYRNNYFVLRHGWSEANERAIIDSRAGERNQFGLTKRGREQIDNLRLDQFGPETIVVTSDFRRTQETAERVAQKIGALPPIETSELRERDFGEFHGLKNDAYNHASLSDPRHRSVETMPKIVQRVQRLINQLEKDYADKEIIIVSHGDTIKAIEGVLYAISSEGIGYMKYRAHGELHAIGDAPPVDFPATFFRVSVKAIIRNKEGHVLCVKEGMDDWSLPGGGLEHNETVQQCLQRELDEEVASGAATFSMRAVGHDSIYIGSKRAWLLWAVYDVEFDDFTNFRPGTDADEVAFIDPKILKESSSRLERMIYKWCVDQNFEVERW